jgi:hypothetical protein
MRVERLGNVVRSTLIVLCLLGWTFGWDSLSIAEGQSTDFRLSGPYGYKNLTVYLIHGADREDTTKMLTLEEAIEQRKVVVRETSNVNELSVENTSDDHHVFLQAGDIVKGGKQDRVVANDLVLKPRSGIVPLPSFCVENGRWTKRGGENVQAFEASKNRLNSKALKLAAQEDENQGTVWQKVAEVQDKLGSRLKKSVRAAQSASSLQLSIEDKDVSVGASEYVTALTGLLAQSPDSIGYTFGINGQINSGDIYAGHDLFARLWGKLLNASAMEAFAEFDEKIRAKELAAETVKEFIEHAGRGSAVEKNIGQGNKVRKVVKKESFYYESLTDQDRGSWIHRGYVAK